MAAACGQVHYSARWIKLQELFLFHGRGGTPGRPPGLCLLGIFRRSIFIKPSPWGEGAPVRTLGRMRGQSEKQASLEELCRGGVLTARPAFPNFAGEFRRLRAASYFAHGGKVTKTPPGTRPMDYGSAMLRLGP